MKLAIFNSTVATFCFTVGLYSNSCYVMSLLFFLAGLNIVSAYLNYTESNDV